MSRSVPWRNKPTNLIAQMIPVSAELKLYLLSQIGPTSFLFKDEHDNRFKVSIGSKISCSCAVVSNDHCIHTLFVMLKKYKVPETHPIIWQASYLDSELEGLIQLKYMEKKKPSVPKYVPKKKNKPFKDQQDDFPPLGEDVTCPICFDDMEGQCYSTCSTCRKSIHSECLKVWVRQKQYDGVAVTCPMCRSQFSNPTLMVMRDLQKWSKRFTTHKGSHCKTCGAKNIQGLLYRCLICPNTELCRLCYDSYQHYQHQHFFFKQMATQAWKYAPIRQKKKKFTVQYRPQVKTEQYQQNIQSTQFLMSLFPTIKDQDISKGLDSLNIIGNDMLNKQMCFKCQTVGNQTMRKLYCSHSIHATCLQSIIENKQYVCEIDGEAICPGYMSALGISIPKKKQRTADCGFIRANQQSEKIKVKLGSKGIVHLTEHKQPTKKQATNFSIGKKVQRFNEKERNRENSQVNKFNAKSKDRNFRIMKKNMAERRQDLESLGVGVGFGSPMMVTGLTNNHSYQHQALLPKPPSNQLTRGRFPQGQRQ